MGEYAIRSSDHSRVKIGTCEQMYYLRADQAVQVMPESGNVDPMEERFDIRFRFPFPDEDNVRPGDFEDYDRTVRVDGPDAIGAEHHTVLFKADNGYLLNLPCPEGMPSDSLTIFTKADDGSAVSEFSAKIHKNGYGGSFGVHSQKWVRADEFGPERLVTVVRCKGCGSMWRLHSFADAEPVIVALRQEADNAQRRAAMAPGWPDDTLDGHAEFLRKIADRIEAGYQQS